MLGITTRAARCAATIGMGAMLIGALAGCGSDSTSAGTGKISLLLTDAPGDVKAAVVTIAEIDLQGSGGTTVLMNTPVTTDLLTLSNSTAQLVQDAVVPAGSYTQLRFVITGAYIAVDNGNGGTSIYASSPTYAGLPSGAVVSGALQMPSFGQSGLKVDLPGGNVSIASNEKILLVDFNVAQSFGQVAGGSGQWAMHPVVKATDVEFSGGLTVQMTQDASLTMPTLSGSPLTLGQFSAVITASDNSTHTLALTDAGNGVFQAQFQYLPAGSYSVNFTAPTGVTFTTNPTVPTSAAVTAGEVTTSAFVLTAATVAP